MKKRFAVLIMMALLLSCCLGLPKTVYAYDGNVELQIGSNEVTVGTTFDVSLFVSFNEGVPGFTNAYYALVFPQDLLQFQGASSGSANEAGGVLLVEEDLNGAATSYVCTYTFTALKAGDAVITANLYDTAAGSWGFGFTQPFDGRDFADLAIPAITVHVKDLPTEPPTEEPTEEPTEAPTEEPTEAPTVPITDAPTNPPVSGNANLSSLAVAPGEILEAFSPDRTSYTVSELDYSVRSINVGATTEDPNATIVVSGFADLKVGTNIVKLLVTAPDGTQKEYSLEVTRKNKDGQTVVTPPTEAPTDAPTQAPTEKPTEAPTEEPTQGETEDPTEEPTTNEDETLPPSTGDVEVSNIYDGTGSMLIKSDWLDEAMPAGFSRSSVSYKGTDVAVAKSKKDMVLYCLASQDGSNKNFYVYNTENDTFYPYYPVNPTGGVYVLLNTGTADVTEGLRQVTLRVNEDGPKINAWSLSGDVNDGVFLVYAMAEDGSIGWYRFDTTIGTFVRYFKDAADKKEPTETPTEPVKEEDSNSAAKIKNLEEELKKQKDKNNQDINDYNELQSNHSKLSIYFILILIVLFIVLILAIIMALKLRSLYSRYDFSDDGDDGDDDGGDDNNGGDDGNGDSDVEPEAEKPQEKIVLPKQAPFGVETPSDEKLPSQTVDESIKQTVAAAYAARQAEKEAKAKEAAQKAAAAKEAAAKEVAEKEAKAKEAAQKAAAAKKAADAAAEKAKAAGMKLNAVNDKKGLYDLDVNTGEEKIEKASGNDEANDDDFEFIEF